MVTFFTILSYWVVVAIGFSALVSVLAFGSLLVMAWDEWKMRKRVVSFNIELTNQEIERQFEEGLARIESYLGVQGEPIRRENFLEMQRQVNRTQSRHDREIHAQIERHRGNRVNWKQEGF